jgi:hypothetical protein
MLPTIRGADFVEPYLNNAEMHKVDLSKAEFMVLTEDHVDKAQYVNVFKEHGVEATVLNQRDRDKEMQALGLQKYHEELIPKKHRSEESFGLLYMWMHGHKYGFTIDDDTLPIDQFDFIGGHIKNLNFKGKITELSSDKKFANVLHQSFNKYHLYPRGYPFAARYEKISKREIDVSKIGMSQGLWTNIPDLDSVTILSEGDLNGQSKTRMNAGDYKENFVVAKGNYVTVCSMNLAFRREVIPGFYQFKMKDNPWKVDRFDDIWSGLVAKKLIDELDYYIINGKPLLQHNKAPRSSFMDLGFEAPGLEANEHLFKIIDAADTSSKDVFEKVEAIAKAMQKEKHPFISMCGGNLATWIEMLRKVS